jgi:hypothetical protein
LKKSTEKCKFTGFNIIEWNSSVLETILTKFKNFSEENFSCFTYRADVLRDLLDALSGNTD